MISLIPATAGGRCDITVSQQISQTAQERIDKLVRRTREKEEERRKKKKELQVGEASSSSQECPSDSDKGQETTIATSAAGHTVLIRRTGMGDESARARKTDDELGQEEEIDVEEQEEIDVEEHEKVTVEQESESTDDDDESGDEPSIVEFEDPVYELSQMYEMESEYENMTLEQEATEVQGLTAAEQAKYRELSRLHQCQVEIEKKMTGMSKVIKERT